MKVGIIFGGRSREREVSFAGGRTVYDNLDKALFSPVPIFVDSLGNFILLDWEFIYKGTIRDFYPPAVFIPDTTGPFQIYIESLSDLSDDEMDKLIGSVGRRIQPSEFSKLIDFAFLTLHGPFGEDGSIQGLLEWYGIPYSGSGILPSAIGISKSAQKQMFGRMGFAGPKWRLIESDSDIRRDVFEELKKEIGLPMVIKAPHQGSSIGIGIVKSDDFAEFEAAAFRACFKGRVVGSTWRRLSMDEKIGFVASLADIREGLGMPLMAHDTLLTHPQQLLELLDAQLPADSDAVILQSPDYETILLVESFIKGKEFSCIVIEDEEGNPLALPPTEIRKRSDVFDYKAKYLPGISRKITPIPQPPAVIAEIRKQCSDLFLAMQSEVYARIDGFVTEEGAIFLNDPNTTSGMLPSSFFFHQAAEIGINPSQFLTYIIRSSLKNRAKTTQQRVLLRKLDTKIANKEAAVLGKKRVAVIMGGFSSERHISVESGRNIYEKLSSSTKYEPIPVFLSGDEANHVLHRIPINIMLKDNADDILEYITHYKPNEVLEQIKTEAAEIRKVYGSEGNLRLEKLSYEDLAKQCDAVFIALHGRPGEDGAIQTELERVGLPYNGSGVESSRITINKFDTNAILRREGILVAGHRMVFKDQYEQNRQKLLEELEDQFKYPFIAKPADDGCSSAVKKIKNREELLAYMQMAFRESLAFVPEASAVLKLKETEEFPSKAYFLVEDLISSNGASRFLEITGGLLTKVGKDGQREYIVFEASEALAQGEVLSLEEKFLAGEGQNITPARYAKGLEENKRVSNEVKKVLKRVAEILNVEGYARIDAFVRIYPEGRVEVIVIEVNSLPGMTPATCIFHQAAIEKMKPFEFIDAILEYGMSK